MKTEDGSNMAVDQEMPFRVIEFNKDQKRIILSHTNIWRAEEIEKQQAEKTARANQAKKTSKSILIQIPMGIKIMLKTPLEKMKKKMKVLNI